MARCIIDGLTIEQAKTFAEWYEGQGEQDAGVWFEVNEVPTPMTDVGRPGGCIEIQADGDVTVHCKPVSEEQDDG